MKSMAKSYAWNVGSYQEVGRIETWAGKLQAREYSPRDLDVAKLLPSYYPVLYALAQMICWEGFE